MKEFLEFLHESKNPCDMVSNNLLAPISDDKNSLHDPVVRAKYKRAAMIADSMKEI